MSAVPAHLTNLSRALLHGDDVIRLSLEEYTLHSPPVPTDRRAYLNGDEKDVKKQKFEHTHLPDKRTYLAWDRARQLRLEEQEWERRLNGVWFFNCGEPTYLTGRHYYYLNYHRYKKNAKPEYREANLEFFWVWEYCAEHPYSFGLYLHTRRRDGKTSRSASIGLEAATRIPNFRFIIASKTDESARRSVYDAEIIRPLKALRDCPWFMPQLVGKIDPVNNVEFGTRSTTAAAAQLEASGMGDLSSTISWILPTPNAGDSDDADLFFNDEVAKDQPYDAYKRWMTIRPQLIPNGIIKGKSINATTTDRADDKEDEGEGKAGSRGGGTSAKQAKKFWRTSDHTKLKPGESTESGLFRLFVSARKGFLTDEYGRDTQAGLDHFLKRRANLTGVALLNEKRENPLTIDEALLEPVNENCEFNAGHIQDNLDAIEAYEQTTGKPLAGRWRLEWKNPVTWEPPVRAVPDKEGPWQFTWLPDAQDQNLTLPMGFATDKSGKRWRSFKPMNVDAFDIGVDPIQRLLSSINNKRKASQFAISIFRPWDPAVERRRGQPAYWPSNAFIGRYNNRPENAGTAYEELFKACHLFGCEASVEKQSADALFELAQERGYADFMADKPQILETDKPQEQAGPGTAASAPTVGRMVRQFTQFVTDYMGSELTVNSRGQLGVNDAGVPYDFRRNPFKESLRDNRDFDMEDRKKSDDTMAQLNAYGHSRRLDRRPGRDDEDDEQGIDPQTFDAAEYYSR